MKFSNRNKSQDSQALHNFTHRENSKPIFQNASIDSKMDNSSKNENHSPQKPLNSRYAKNRSMDSINADASQHKKIVTNMTFNRPNADLTEQLAAKVDKNVPSLLVESMTKNMWKNLANTNAAASKTHNELKGIAVSRVQPSRGGSGFRKTKTFKKQSMHSIVRS